MGEMDGETSLVNAPSSTDEMEQVLCQIPRAAMSSIPVELTMLSHLRNKDCCQLLMTVIVPEGLQDTRLIRVNHERKTFEFVVPDGVVPGETLTVSIPRIPPLDAESKEQIFNQLAHPLRWRQKEVADGETSTMPIFTCDETRKELRMQHYQSLKGCNMNPTVATIDELEVLEDESVQQLPELDLLTCSSSVGEEK